MISLRSLRLLVILLALSVTVAPLGAAAQPLRQGGTVYVVKRGDTLSQIAGRLGVSTAELARANGLTNANFVYVGQRLLVPRASQPKAAATPAASVPRVTPAVKTTSQSTPVLSAQAAPARGGLAASAAASQALAALPAPEPAPAQLPDQAAAAPAGSSAAAAANTHVVQRGETLSKIAARYGMSLQSLMAANQVRKADMIYAGQRLVIPGSSPALKPNPNPNPAQNAAPNANPNPAANPAPGQAPDSAAKPAASSAPEPAPERWIDVNLATQNLTAYEGQTPVFTAQVSSGLPRTPTIVGTFKIYLKLAATTMDGEDYYLPNVPYTMFFHGDYGIHGTYWHNNFGHPMSHGCVNVSTPAAAWLYGWAPVGTQVVTHY